METFSKGRFTTAFCTPATAVNAFSIDATQPAQCIPSIRYVDFISLPAKGNLINKGS